MKLHRSINEAAVPLLMYTEKRPDFIKRNTYRTEKNVRKASQGPRMETKIIQNGLELWWTLKRKDKIDSGPKSKNRRTRERRENHFSRKNLVTSQQAP